jgi:hypothetical protein
MGQLFTNTGAVEQRSDDGGGSGLVGRVNLISFFVHFAF